MTTDQIFSGIRSLSDYLSQNVDYYGYSLSDRFQKTETVQPDEKTMTMIAGFLLSSWSAEHHLNIRPIKDSDRVDTSFGWSFPMTYHSALFSTKAVLYLAGFENAVKSHQDVRLTLGNVLNDVTLYPEWLSFLIQVNSPNFFNYLSLKEPLCKFLVETKQLRYEETSGWFKSQADQLPDHVAIDDFVSRVHFLDLLDTLSFAAKQRLTLSDGYTVADVIALRDQLSSILYHINAINELIIAKRIGLFNYVEMVSLLPTYLTVGNVSNRSMTIIVPAMKTTDV